MSTKHLTIAVAALLLLLGAAAWAQEEATARCGDCHDQAKAFAHNPHARGQVVKGDVENAVCESCHGDATEHMQTGDKEKISVPRGRKGADETCAMCHDLTSDKRSHKMGFHASSDAVNCLSCHSVHKSEQEPLLAKNQLALCSTCHTQAASFRNRPYTHKMGRAGMTCSTCHEPHGRPGKENLKATAAGEVVCVGCHTDKRGPYVFAHGGAAVGECTNCHEAHGSSNQRQLKRANVAQLCLECHSPTATHTLGSQPPSFHNVTTARYQNCTTCHVAIHGSHRSPQLLK
ncbi:MAG TPA: cytochrome c3 family protein [Thermoanaerobaculia bacterium]|nr:cytochrome c3 family protein [Thermoanaerobaculia bacterium]